MRIQLYIVHVAGCYVHLPNGVSASGVRPERAGFGAAAGLSKVAQELALGFAAVSLVIRL